MEAAGVCMNRVFEPQGFFTVPDGTDVSPFLNATDIKQADVPWGVLGDMSIAAGRVGPGVCSAVHTHLVVTQVTYVVSGELTVRMKEDGANEFYDLALNPGQAVLTKPRTLLQLRNEGSATAAVLYIVSPSYVCEMDSNAVVYDDAVVVANSWEELAARAYDVPALAISTTEAEARREEAKHRLAAMKASS